MAKTQTSIYFTAVLLVLVLASIEIPKTEAACFTFLGECDLNSTCTSSSCKTCCEKKFSTACAGKCENHSDGLHCHCYGP